VAALPSEAETLGRYQLHYAKQFPPERIEPSRRQLLASVVARAGTLSAPGRLLDVGCGGGHLLAMARTAGWRPLGTDIAHEACRAAGTTAPVVRAAAEALPFRAGSLDAVTLVNVLDHTTRPGAVVREAARVLRPGGLLVVRVPNGAFHARVTRVLSHLGLWVRWRSWDTYPILHLFAFGPRALRRLVERSGFEVLSVENSELAGPRALRRVAAVVAGTVHAASGRRWVIGPSLELCARRCAGP
jgi:SAM-dependent methyltransferase